MSVVYSDLQQDQDVYILLFSIYTVESLERESECECASQQVNTSLLLKK